MSSRPSSYGSGAVSGIAPEEALLSLGDFRESDGEDHIEDLEWIRQLALQINNSVSVASANLAVVSEMLEAQGTQGSDTLEALSDARSAISRIAQFAAALATNHDR